MIIDSHCHLDKFYSRHDLLSKLITEFEPISLSPHFISMSINSVCWQDVIHLSKQFSQVHAALGIHPWYIESIEVGDFLLLESMLEHDEVVAIGEIGLDFGYKYKHTRIDQIELLNMQLALAVRYNKPVSLHVVKAHHEMFESLASYPITGVVHGLSGSGELARRYIDHGLKIGVNAVVIRDNARRYHEMVQMIGLEHLVLETDFPNICRPEESEPQLGDIVQVANKVAVLLDVSFDSVVRGSNHNVNSIFQLKRTLIC